MIRLMTLANCMIYRWNLGLVRSCLIVAVEYFEVEWEDEEVDVRICSLRRKCQQHDGATKQHR